MAGDDAAAAQEAVAAEAPEANGTAELPNLGTAPVSEPPAEEITQEQKAEAALAEKTNHKATYKVGESVLEVQLPAKLNASVMFRAGVLRDDDGAGAARLIQSVLGHEQFEAVMDKMDDEGLTIDDEEAMTSIGNLLNDALAIYGVTPGESEASPKS